MEDWFFVLGECKREKVWIWEDIEWEVEGGDRKRSVKEKVVGIMWEKMF